MKFLSFLCILATIWPFITYIQALEDTDKSKGELGSELTILSVDGALHSNFSVTLHPAPKISGGRNVTVQPLELADGFSTVEQCHCKRAMLLEAINTGVGAQSIYQDYNALSDTYGYKIGSDYEAWSADIRDIGDMMNSLGAPISSFTYWSAEVGTQKPMLPPFRFTYVLSTKTMPFCNGQLLMDCGSMLNKG